MDNQQENTQNAQIQQLRSLTRLSHSYETTGYMHFAAACHIQCLALCRALQHRAEEARVLAQLGHVYDTLGNVDEAIESCEHSVIIAREVGDRQTECIALATHGTAYIHLGYAHRALDEGQQSLTIAEELAKHAVNTHETRLEVVAMHCLGDAHSALEQTAQAIPYYIRALAYAGLMREPLAMLYEKLGLAYTQQKEYAQALTCYTEGLQLAGQVNALYIRGRIHAHLCDLYSVQQQWEQSEFHLAQAQTLIDTTHIYRGQALLTHYHARLLHRQGRLEEAHHHYSTAIKLFDDVQDRYNQAASLFDDARLLREQRNEDEAKRVAHAALWLYKERGTEEQVRKVEEWIQSS